MDQPVGRDKLGLALAGGGFRASLFHVGVFRRLAELDLLRYVEVVSAVSGGSIVAALYALLLKRDLEKPQCKGRLTRAQYLDIVDDLERRLCLGIQKDLRTRLLLNPLNILSGALSGDNLSRAMADLYERHLYRQTIAELKGIEPAAGRMRLTDIKISPGGNSITELGFKDLDSYNSAQVAEGGSCITKLILNATSLNTGSRFWFSASEMGEWDNGYLHAGDATVLFGTIKPQVDRARRKHRQALAKADSVCAGASIPWWISAGQRDRLPPEWCRLFESWQAFFVHGDNGTDSLDALRTCRFGSLRAVRRAAWYLKHWPSHDGVDTFGGLTLQQHRLVLAAKLATVCHQYAERVQDWFHELGEGELFSALCDFIDDIYLVRSADYLADSAADDLEGFPLSHAVAASANFPPVFAPFQLTTFYDNLHVSRLGLTDGGVYDNLGVIGLMDEDCNYIISSDTGQTSGPKNRVSTGRIGMLKRILSVLTDDDARQTRDILLERHRVSAGLAGLPCEVDSPVAGDVREHVEELSLTRELVGVAAFKIDSPEVCEREAGRSGRKNARDCTGEPVRLYSAKDLAKIRTDLDAFGDIEMDALIEQGYANAGLFIGRWLAIDTERRVPSYMACRYDPDRPESYPYRAAADSDGAYPPPRRCAREVSPAFRYQVIRAARWRWPHVLFLPRSPWCYLAWASLLALLACGWWASTGRTVDVADGLRGLIVRGLFLRELGLDGPVSWHRLLATIGIIAAAVALFMLVVKVWFPVFEWLRERGYTSVARYMAYIGRWPRLVRAFVASLVYKVVILLVALLVYAYSRLYLWATNLGPWRRSCRTRRDDR